MAPSAGSHDWDWATARAICLRETRRVLRDPHAAEDAAQEAVLRAWNARSSCDTAQSFHGWLRAIAGNEARRLGERRTRTQARETAGEMDDTPETSSTLDERLGVIACDQILAPLPPADRDMMRLRYLDGLTQPQIADSLGLPEGTVKIRLHRSRKRVHTLLTNEALGGRH
jgi:RNA polymerase sigma-70 factor (ECF subfamily)